ncbi:MAG TPA: hypothetical protein VFF82_02070 [Rhodocyclaceae bacterium]|nr:hypothetical protein [Rhodocyclaceae bacterium]
MNAERLAIAILACLAAGMTSAQGLPDPTRPPVVLDTAPAVATQTKTGVQSIVRRQGAKSAAVINGQLVELGGRVGDARLVEIGEDSVVLQTGFGRETLHLTPGIGKKPVTTESGGAKRQRVRRAKEEAKP